MKVLVIDKNNGCVLGPYVREFFSSEGKEMVVYRHPLGYSTAFRSDVIFQGESASMPKATFLNNYTDMTKDERNWLGY